MRVGLCIAHGNGTHQKKREERERVCVCELLIIMMRSCLCSYPYPYPYPYPYHVALQHSTAQHSKRRGAHVSVIWQGIGMNYYYYC